MATSSGSRSSGSTSAEAKSNGNGSAAKTNGSTKRTTAAVTRTTKGNGKTTRTTRAAARTTDGTTTPTAGATKTETSTTRGRTTGRGRPARTSAAGADGATARARLSSAARTARSKKRSTDTGGSHQPPPEQADMPIAEPTATGPADTVPANDEVMAASNARRALNPDMPRVAWLRTQLNQMEARQRERLLKVGQLTLIAIVFITFVLQNAQGVNVHFLFFSLNIRLIWVIFGCAFLGGAAGYLVGRPDKSLRALLPQREKPARPATAKKRTAGL